MPSIEQFLAESGDFEQNIGAEKEFSEAEAMSKVLEVFGKLNLSESSGNQAEVSHFVTISTFFYSF